MNEIVWEEIRWRIPPFVFDRSAVSCDLSIAGVPVYLAPWTGCPPGGKPTMVGLPPGGQPVQGAR